MHDDAYIGGRSDGRTKQLDIFCRITGFTSDILSFIVVELIRFFQSHSILLTDRLVQVFFRFQWCCPVEMTTKWNLLSVPVLAACLAHGNNTELS